MPSSEDDFQMEAAERLASLETKQDSLADRVEDLNDGQGEILDKLESAIEERSELATEDELAEAEQMVQDLAEDVEANEKKHERYRAVVKFTSVVLGLITGGSAYVLNLI